MRRKRMEPQTAKATITSEHGTGEVLKLPSSLTRLAEM